jgi:lipopolysaccharide transport system permease protein
MATTFSRTQVPAIVIQPSRGFSTLALGEVWEYRHLLYFLVWRDIKSRYRQMALGPLWILLQPLISMVIYTVLLGWVAKLPSQGIPYPVFIYAAQLPWTFFASAVNSGSICLLENKELLTKVYFPRLLIPLSRILASLVDFSMSFVILLGMIAAYGIRSNAGILLIPVYLLVAATVGLGVGLWFAGIVVRYRDFREVISLLIRGWMFATPVVYSISIVPERWRTLYSGNPMTGVVEGFRWALLGTARPPVWTLLLSVPVFVLVFVGGLYKFRRVERSIVDFV